MTHLLSFLHSVYRLVLLWSNKWISMHSNAYTYTPGQIPPSCFIFSFIITYRLLILSFKVDHIQLSSVFHFFSAPVVIFSRVIFCGPQKLVAPYPRIFRSPFLYQPADQFLTNECISSPTARVTNAMFYQPRPLLPYFL